MTLHTENDISQTNFELTIEWDIGVPTAGILEQIDHGWFQSDRRYIAVHTQVHSAALYVNIHQDPYMFSLKSALQLNIYQLYQLSLKYPKCIKCLWNVPNVLIIFKTC